jgi:rhodanese-related sulfurtransferase
MSLRRVDPAQAAALLGEGWTYLDVRSVPEFDEGHPTGAYNVPFMHKGPGGMSPNPDFGTVVSARFPRDARLLVGCKSGVRSQKACAALESLGYSQLIDVRGGFGGEVDSLGQVTVAGWKDRNLPVTTQAEAGRTFAELKEGN